MHNKDLIDIIKNFYINNIFSIRQVAEIFKIPKSTVHRWLHLDIVKDASKVKIQNNQNTEKRNKYKKIIYNELTVDPLLKAKELQQIILKKTTNTISISSIYIYIHQLGFTFKKVQKRNFTNEIILLKQQQIFENKIKNIKYKDIICIDESYFYSNSHNDYGWVNNKTETIVYNKANPTKYTLIMAINHNKIVSYDLIKNKNVNQILFLNFLKNKVFPFCDNKYILMDNVRFHKTKVITELFHNSNNKLLFIPPYSPQYNPIENVFAIIKNKYKQYHNVHNISSIIEHFDLDLWNFYDHAFNNFKFINNIFI